MSFVPVYKFALREDLKDHPEFLPTKGEPLATGWDVRSAEDMIIRPLQHVKIPLGFRGFCPEGWWYELKPRSSTFAKKKLHSLYGTIDETYEGELVFACQFIPAAHYIEDQDNYKTWFSPESWEDYCSDEIYIKFGDAIGQIVPIKRQEIVVESITNEEYDMLCKKRSGIRGAGGFGSTSK
jgi:dUTPase